MESVNLYKKYNKGEHWKEHPTEYAKTFAEFLKSINFNRLIVDLGCGNRRDVNEIAKSGFNIIGIDKFKEIVEEASEKYPNSRFEVQDIENMKFKDSSIDAFYMINVIHYLNKEKVIKEILRTLKPKGYLFIHFNLSITDINSKIDYEDNEKSILKLLNSFDIINKRNIIRQDKNPIPHTHKILELVLQKK